MVYNYNREKHAFDQRWTYLHKAYSHAGMSETAIADIYKFDKEEFNCTRREREHALVSLVYLLREKFAVGKWLDVVEFI